MCIPSEELAKSRFLRQRRGWRGEKGTCIIGLRNFYDRDCLDLMDFHPASDKPVRAKYSHKNVQAVCPKHTYSPDQVTQIPQKRVTVSRVLTGLSNEDSDILA